MTFLLILYPCLMLANMRSLVNKIDKLFATIITYKTDIVAICETWLTPEIPDSILTFPKFHFHRRDRHRRKGGGVCIWTRANLKP